MKRYIIAIMLGQLIGFAGQSQDLSQLYKELSPSVVVIHTLSASPTPLEVDISKGLGTGVIIDKEGLILTASHVVHSADLIKVEMHDGKEYLAEVVSSVPSADIALIKLKTKPHIDKVPVLGNSDEVMIGEQIFIIGSPLGLVYSLSSGHISGKHKNDILVGGKTQLEFLQTDAAINKGNSGGPMFNLRGEIIGIVSFILSKNGASSGLGFAAASNVAREILLEGSAFWTGFEGIFLGEEMAVAFNVPQKSGLLVQRVVEGSPADLIGLRGGKFKAIIGDAEIRIGGDIILDIQVVSCNTPHNFSQIRDKVEGLQTVDTLRMSVLRGGVIVELIGADIFLKPTNLSHQ